MQSIRRSPPPVPRRAREEDTLELRTAELEALSSPNVEVPRRAGRATPPPIPAASDAGRRAREAHELVTAAQAGDPRAFDALVRRYRPRIFALALHMTGSPSDADDIVQDAFVRAFRNLGRFEGRSEFFTWLYRIALNRALNVRRDRSRRRTQDIDDPRVDAAVQVDAGGDPHRAMELRQTYGHLVRAFDRLSPLLRTTVALTMMQGLSYPEAAVVLEATEGTIAWRIHEARKQLRAALNEELAKPRPARVATRPSEPPEAASLELALALLAPSV
jgi:RNA polymerase sigma-70 factor, ECF subfamily